MSLFSNSKIDVPLTSDLQDLISGVVKEDKTWLKSFSDVMSSRKQKITDWFSKWKQRTINFGKKTLEIGKIIKSDDINSKETNK